MDDILLELGGASLRESARSATYRWNNNSRKLHGAILQYTWSGEGSLRRGDTHQTCGPGQALLMLEGDQTEYFYPADASESWEFTWVCFHGASQVVAELIRQHGDVIALHPKGETVGAMNTVARLYEAKGFQDRYHACEELARLLCSLGRELSDLRTEGEIPVRQALAYLRDHHRRPINIKEVAAHFSVSREHFSRIFHAEAGMTPAQHLRDLRLQTARHLLQRTKMPIGAVAESSGFAGASHFCRAFKAAFGQTPQTARIA